MKSRNTPIFSPDPFTATNVAAYFSFGGHSASLGRNFVTDGTVRFQGNSGWYVMTCYESFSGHRGDPTYSTYVDWYQAVAFGGTNYENTPAGVVANGVEDSSSQRPIPYFQLWASGKNSAISGWQALTATKTFGPVAIGDPFLKH